jgi:uncharacterized integral membrane protein (TIGR00698 family)
LPVETYYSRLSEEALNSLASMEGLDMLASPVVTVRRAETAPATKATRWIGYAAAAVVASAAYALHVLYKPISAAILAILIGALARNLASLPGAVLEGCKGLVRRVIPITIVLTGATLNLTDIGKGAPYFMVILGAIVSGTLGALWAGRLFGTRHKTALLVGAGTSICGTSAIVAVAPIVDADDEDLLLSVSTINILGLLIMLLLPGLGSILAMKPESFGVWAGTTVHAVPQAVTTGFAYGPESGTIATLVKLVRVTLLAPFILALALFGVKRAAGGKLQMSKLLPSFIYGFAALAVLNTLGLLPELTFHPLGAAAVSTFGSAKALAETGNILLTLSMAAMGLEVNVRMLIRTGGPALVTGVAASVAQGLTTFLLIRWLVG